MRFIASIGVGMSVLSAISSAQAAPALQADVQMSQWSYSLRDLTPGDTSPPSLRQDGGFSYDHPGSQAEARYFVLRDGSYGTRR